MLEGIDLEGNQCDANVLEEIDLILKERQRPQLSAPRDSSGLGAAIGSLTANNPNLNELRLDGRCTSRTARRLKSA